MVIETLLILASATARRRFFGLPPCVYVPSRRLAPDFHSNLRSVSVGRESVVVTRGATGNVARACLAASAFALLETQIFILVRSTSPFRPEGAARASFRIHSAQLFNSRPNSDQFGEMLDGYLRSHHTAQFPEAYPPHDPTYSSRRVLSYQTSSSPGAIRKRQPGGSARYGAIRGRRRAMWASWTGRKKLGSSERTSSAQIYHPDECPSGGWRNPLSGQLSPRVLSAIPWMECARLGTGSAPYLAHVWDCSRVNKMLLDTKVPFHTLRESRQLASLYIGTGSTLRLYRIKLDFSTS